MHKIFQKSSVNLSDLQHFDIEEGITEGKEKSKRKKQILINMIFALSMLFRKRR